MPLMHAEDDSGWIAQAKPLLLLAGPLIVNFLAVAGMQFADAIMAGRLRHFASRNAADIEGLGGRSIDLFLAEGLVAGPADLFTLEPVALTALPGWGGKSVERLQAGLDAARSRP